MLRPGMFGIRIFLLLAFTGLGLTSGCIAERTDSQVPEGELKLCLYSEGFSEGGTIPGKFGCNGQERSPALNWCGVPEGTASFAILLEDLDIPWLRLTHWIVYDIPPASAGLSGCVPPLPALPDGLRQGVNDFHTIGYRGPCPPPGHAHRYQFTIYALDRFLGDTKPLDRDKFNRAIEGAVIGKGSVTGFYYRT